MMAIYSQVFDDQTGTEPGWKGGEMNGKPGCYQKPAQNNDGYLFTGL